MKVSFGFADFDLSVKVTVVGRHMFFSLVLRIGYLLRPKYPALDEDSWWKQSENLKKSSETDIEDLR